MNAPPKTMRDTLIGRVREAMASDDSLYFLTADLGAPALDALKNDFPRRCINVGIAEQNLIAMAAGLALEGCTVFAYAIAPFVSMRAYEQIRSTVALLSSSRDLNLNIVSLGAGFSYDVSGPTHQCIEDIPLMRLLPGIELFSPSDSATVDAFFDYAVRIKRPKYLRLDGKPLPAIHSDPGQLDFSRGFSMLDAGKDVCLVTTGFATHNGRRVVETLRKEGVPIGHVDFYCPKNFDREGLARVLSGYENVFTIEESFVRRGGMDALVADLLEDFGLPARLKRYGPSEKYIFENGGREYLHRAYGMDEATILDDVRAVLR